MAQTAKAKGVASVRARPSRDRGSFARDGPGDGEWRVPMRSCALAGSSGETYGLEVVEFFEDEPGQFDRVFEAGSSATF